LAAGGWFGVGVGVRVVMTLAPGAVPSLLPGVWSGVAEVLLAVLLTLPDAGAMKLMLRVTLAALVKVTGGKVTIPEMLSYVPSLLTMTPVKPGMMLSVIVMLSAVLGPLFWVTMS